MKQGDIDPRRALSGLLCRFYTVDELREFFTWRSRDEDLIHELPTGACTPIKFAEEAILALERRGELDEGLISDLLEERPHMREALVALAPGLGVDMLALAPASSRAPRVSATAVFETLIACSAAVALALRFEGARLFLLSAVLVPFALMRSQQSTARGARWYLSYLQWIKVHLHVDAGRETDELALDVQPLAPLQLVLASVLTVVGAAVIRVAAVLCHPIAGAFAIPANWRFQILCLDLHRAPELVANTGGRAVGDTIVWIYLSVFIAPIFAIIVWSNFVLLGCVLDLPSVHIVFKIYILVACSMVLGCNAYSFYLVLGRASATAILGAASLVTRFSVKCTAIFWLPLVLVAPASAERRMPVAMFMRYCSTGRLPGIARMIAMVLLGLPPLHLVMTEGPARELARALHVPIEPMLVCLSLAGAAGACVLVRDYLVIEQGPYFIHLGRWTRAGVERAVVATSIAVRLLVAATLVLTAYMLVLRIFNSPG